MSWFSLFGIARGGSARKHPFSFYLSLGLLAGLVGCGAGTPLLGPPTDNSGNSSVEREIEEADIIKLQDGYFYIANPFTGLRIVDARNMDALASLGRVDLGGRAVELFVRDDLAFVFTTADFFDCAGMPVGFHTTGASDVTRPDYEGTRLWVINIADKNNPEVVTTLDSAGFVTAVRRVGDVIYAAGNVASTSNGSLSPPTASNPYPYFRSGVFVASVNIADPENVHGVAYDEFPGSSLDIHVSSQAMYVIGDDPSAPFSSTLITYVDISDPTGQITRRGQFSVPGHVLNRFFVDDFESTFRIITEGFDDRTFQRLVTLYTYDVTDPDAVTRLGQLLLITGESLRAVRFDGERAYAVTFVVKDPLFILDLADPAHPVISGELEVPGFSTHLVPLGDRLIGVGIDDTQGTRPAVSLYDVSDPAAPRQLSRIIAGERYIYASSEATVDEKALKVLEDAGLILLPFNTYDVTTGELVDSLQIIGLESDRLVERGQVPHRGLIRRAGLEATRLWVLSDLTMQSVDVDNLDQPAALSSLDFITDQELDNSGLKSCVASARSTGFRLSDVMPGGFENDWRLIDVCGRLPLFPFLLVTLSLTLLMKLRTRKGREG